MWKNVTAKCQGGDIAHTNKLRAKRRVGPNRMASIGSVGIPQNAFMAVIATCAGRQ